MPKTFYRNSQKNLAKGVDNSSEYCYDISVVDGANPDGVEQIHFLVYPDPISKLSARL
jgi:hypothetical protein